MPSQDSKKSNKITITQIKDNQFLIEGYCNKIKICGENEYSVSSIEYEYGPHIHIGHDFMGRGTVTGIHIIETDTPEYIMVKIIVSLDKE